MSKAGAFDVGTFDVGTFDVGASFGAVGTAGCVVATTPTEGAELLARDTTGAFITPVWRDVEMPTATPVPIATKAQMAKTDRRRLDLWLANNITNPK
ncbi:hypothetical protein [Acidisphaera sp. L21]|uniref:hypothetical protein n=1 Tax=Acidisphaera sp. L21 TaxID=1641851 RepID=UPI00131B3D45|nr:hypothetical protein [Acidisphaera sp. L21]